MKLIKKLLAIIAVLAVIFGVLYILNEKFRPKYITVSDDSEEKPY